MISAYTLLICLLKKQDAAYVIFHISFVYLQTNIHSY